MSDNKLNPEELELREGEHHELLGEPAELFEISAPEEVVLLDTIHEELQALPREDGVTSVAPIGGVVVNEDSTLIESIPEDTPEPVRVESLELSPLVDIEETDPSLFDSITEPSVTTPEPIEVISEDASISPIIITEPYPEPVIAVTPTEELESAVVNVVGETEVPPESPQSQDSVPVVTPSEDVISERAPAMAAPIIPPMIQPKSNKILIVSGIVGACVLI